MSRTAQITIGSVLGALVVGAVPARADSTAGVDSALFRPSYDNNGVFSLDGGRVMPDKDVVWKVLFGYAQRPLAAPVPGIGGATDTNVDNILKYDATLDFTFAIALTKRITFAFDSAAYRTAPDAGYGKRGRYNVDPSQATPSSGMMSLRPFDNFDPTGSSSDPANNQPVQLAGPLDVRAGFKIALTQGPGWSSALLLTGTLPFGEDQMFLGDSGFVFEPKLALDYHFDKLKATRFVLNGGARLRKRTVLEAYDPSTQTPDMAKVVMDVGSEALAGAGLVYEVSPRVMLGAEDMTFIPLPSSMTFGNCYRADGRACSTVTSADYFAGGGAGDFASYAVGGVTVRANGSLGVQLLGGVGLFGHRADQFHVSIGLTWSPQPAGSGELGRGDKDGDGIPDSIDQCPDEPEDHDNFQDEDGCPDLDNDGDGVPDINDACPNEPEDKDNFQDADGCPDRDNDGDGIPDVTDKCPNDKEDMDGFQDADGCPDEDNDGDGFPDNADKCPNDPETVNGYQDDDGCPDVKPGGITEDPDRINLKGERIDFTGGDKLTTGSKRLLDQVADLMKKNKALVIRIEAHVALGTKSKNATAVAAQKKKDKALSERRAAAVRAYLLSAGVPIQQLTGEVGLGSDRPLGTSAPDDPINDRVDFIKAQQRSP